MNHEEGNYRIPVHELRSLFRNRVSLISVRPGSKQMAQKWSVQADGSYPDANTNDKQLATMGIAVRLGNKDHNIISIDFDGSAEDGFEADSLVERFIELNPIAEKTLISKGSRGANIWFRLMHTCPPLQKLEHEGVAIGEFRSDGGLTIIQGLHANKVDHYRFLKKTPVLEVGLDQLVWLNGRSMDQVLKTEMYTRTLELEKDRTVEEKNRNIDGGRSCEDGITEDPLKETPRLQDCDPELIKEVNNLVCRYKCIKPKTSNSQQVPLIRELKWLLHQHGLNASWEWKTDVHKLWFDKSAPYLDPAMSEDDYLIEFMDKWSRLRRKNQENEEVWCRAKNKKVPTKLVGKPGGLQDTAKLCREWAAEIQDDGLFNLGGQQVEMVVPGVKNQVGGYRYLHVLTELEVIELVEKGIPHVKTNRWRYLLDD